LAPKKPHCFGNFAEPRSLVYSPIRRRAGIIGLAHFKA
jgi:hypothetical protein